MTIISLVAFIVSIVGSFGFIIWDEDMVGVPVLYPFGKFLAEWWFHNYSRNRKAITGNFPTDGAPLVATPGSTTYSSWWPYPGVPSDNAGDTPSGATNYGVVATPSGGNNYTPVDGMYGVTKDKEMADNDPNLQWYPQAMSKNDYIASRMLGDGATHQDLTIAVNGEYNKNVFKSGNPFYAATIGKNVYDEDNWTNAPSYSASAGSGNLFMPPLTSLAGGATSIYPFNTTNINTTPIYRTSENDYSGGEYTGIDTAGYIDSAEYNKIYPVSKGERPYWYALNYAGLSMPDANTIQTWPGETINGNLPIGSHDITTPSFYDPQFSGQFVQQSGGTEHYQVSWGDNYNSSRTFDGLNPGQVQSDYIIEMLSQDNPISNLSS